jgi:hypothetical protein
MLRWVWGSAGSWAWGDAGGSAIAVLVHKIMLAAANKHRIVAVIASPRRTSRANAARAFDASDMTRL